MRVQCTVYTGAFCMCGFQCVCALCIVHWIERRQYVQLNEWKVSHTYMQWPTVLYVLCSMLYICCSIIQWKTNKLSFETYTIDSWAKASFESHLWESNAHVRCSLHIIKFREFCFWLNVRARIVCIHIFIKAFTDICVKSMFHFAHKTVFHLHYHLENDQLNRTLITTNAFRIQIQYFQLTLFQFIFF